MSNVRIRYNKPNDFGVTDSRRLFTTADQKQVKVVLNFTEMKYTVLDANTGDVLVGPAGDTVNKNVLKILAKNELVRMGVQFGPEDRAERRKGN